MIESNESSGCDVLKYFAKLACCVGIALFATSADASPKGASIQFGPEGKIFIDGKEYTCNQLKQIRPDLFHDDELWPVLTQDCKPDPGPLAVSSYAPKPLAYKDPASQVTFYVESDGRHVVAIEPTGKIIWVTNPFVDAHLQPYRFVRPYIVEIGPYTGQPVRGNRADTALVIRFNSSQFGAIDKNTGSFTFEGQD